MKLKFSLLSLTTGAMALIFSNFASAATGGTAMNFHGTLVNEPCTVQPGDENITLNFGTVIDKGLYQYQKTNSQPFSIHLVDCAISSWAGDGTVTVKFSGPASTELPGYLAVTDEATGSTDMGIAIGIQTSDGTLLPLDQTTTPILLRDGSDALNFMAFVEGEPSALQNESIKRGSFSAVATFYLEYQ
ncbi:fimbrial protein [Scandinavium goeteborgense]|uniref:fimbrial protein n=1 Tax=Scandinavium goeteborgense TaxID=1851514 RepID=UPI000F672C1A|nr:fimbrial protein [Scandinavium goeteborgense]QKN79776.1 type 1 fimbrial protein [Scandinavium goeteborgense]